MTLIPTMLVRKNGGPVTRINVSDYGKMQAEGYVEYVASAETDVDPAKTEPKPEEAGGGAGAVTKPTLKELRDKAIKLGVVNASKLKEDELLKVLAEVQSV